MSTPIDAFSPAHHGTRLTRGSRPEPTVSIRAGNGSTLTLPVSAAVALIVTDDAELIGTLDPATRDAFDRATNTYLNIHSVARTQLP